MRVIGIGRSAVFSPGRHAENDRLILEATARSLEERRSNVRLIREEDVLAGEPVDAPMVFSMCQGVAANRVLEGLEGRGMLIINAPSAAQRCHRGRLHRTLEGTRDLFIPTMLIPTGGGARDRTALTARVHAFEASGGSRRPGHGLWLKRGDVHSTESSDVVRLSSAGELEPLLAGFRARGIAEAVLEPHIPGTVVKFYGVVGTSFFRFYAEDNFGVSPPAFADARAQIERLVRLLRLEVYGGDAVLTADNRAIVIDINDWPSFAHFRDEAAEVIAAYIHRRGLHGAVPAVRDVTTTTPCAGADKGGD